MMRILFAAIALAMLATACSGGGSKGTPTVAGTATLGPPATADVTTTTLLTEQLNLIVRAVEGGNAAQLSSHVDYLSLPCSLTPTPNGPLCPVGVAANSPVGAFIFISGCNRHYIRVDEQTALSELFSEVLQQKWTTYAIARTNGTWLGLEGIQFVAIFESQGNTNADLQIGVTFDGVRTIARGCGGTPQSDAGAFRDFITVSH